jgi:predicted ATPase
MSSSQLPHLRSIGLFSFKSFEKQSISVGPLTVLVGANASGKSNLFDAIRFIQGIGLDMSLVDILRGRSEGGRLIWPGLRGGISDVAQKGKKHFSIRTNWRLSEETVSHYISCEINRSPELGKETLKSTSVKRYLFDTHARALGSRRGREAESVRVALKRDGKGNSPTQTHSATRSLLHQIDCRPPVSTHLDHVRGAVVQAMKGALFVDIRPELMREYVPRQADVLGVEGENISAVLWQLCQDEERKRDMVDWLSELCAPELADIDFVETGLEDVMLVFVERDGTRIPARSLSNGTLRFLGQVMALQTAPEGSLILMEEIENGLHPTRVHLLIEAIEAVTRTRGIRVIATTHSPLVIGALSEQALGDAVLMARLTDEKGTVMRRLKDLPHFDEISSRRGADTLLATGWLERAL